MPHPRESTSAEILAEVAGGAFPGAGTAVGRITRLVRAEWERNTSTALKVAERVSGMSREDLADLIERDPRLLPPYLRVVWAAGMNGHDQTLRAMGLVFGRAAAASVEGDDVSVEDAVAALNALGDLGPRHFRVLRMLVDHWSANAQPDRERQAAGETQLARDLAMPKDSVSQVIHNLAAAGLVSMGSGFLGGINGAATALGVAVVAAADAVTD